MKKSYLTCIFIMIILVFLDQTLKLWVHFNMSYGAAGQIKLLGNWFKLYYTLNPGMAFGMTLGTKYGKFILSIGRIIACIGILFYIYKQSKIITKKISFSMLSWSFVCGGALGNIFDSVFYGVYLNNSPKGSITPWFHGQVIDMLFLDIFSYKIPTWFPINPGMYVHSLPIFNLADVFITLGICSILIKNNYKN